MGSQRTIVKVPYHGLSFTRRAKNRPGPRRRSSIARSSAQAQMLGPGLGRSMWAAAPLGVRGCPWTPVRRSSLGTPVWVGGSNVRIGTRSLMAVVGQQVPPLAVLAFDRPGSAQLRQSTRLAHLNWAREQPWVRLGGPFFDFNSGNDTERTILGSFLCLRSGFAEQLTNDPYVRAGLFDQSQRYVWRISVGSFSAFPQASIGLTPLRPEPFYLVWGLDKPDALDRRLALRDRHLEWLKASVPHCLVAGAIMPEVVGTKDAAEEFKPRGTILILRGFDSANEVQSWLAEDPYAAGDVFDRIHIYGFQPVLCRSEDPVQPSEVEQQNT